MQLSTEEFVKRLPTIDTLITAYHVPADAAFFLCRPQYTYAINASLYVIISIISTVSWNIILHYDMCSK